MREQTVRKPRAQKLPDLKVSLKQAGRTIRTLVVPDPRKLLITQLNLQYKPYGVSAEVA